MLEVLKSPLLASIPGLQHGFGEFASPLPEIYPGLALEWKAKKAIWKQVHGTASAEVTTPLQPLGEVDALYTRTRELPIGVTTADCVPVLLARRPSDQTPGCIAAVHAGWRGTRAGVLRELWRTLSAQGEKASNWVAAIGPSIGPCCYEVSEELATDFETHFASQGKGLAVPSYRHLDLPAINAAELKAIGISEVDVLRTCTMCTRLDGGGLRFPSYRRDGRGTQLWSVIRMT